MSSPTFTGHDPWLTDAMRHESLLAAGEREFLDALADAQHAYLVECRTTVLGTTGLLAAGTEDQPPNLDAWPDRNRWVELLHEHVTPVLNRWYRRAYTRWSNTAPQGVQDAIREWLAAFDTDQWADTVYRQAAEELDDSHTAGDPPRLQRLRLDVLFRLNAPIRKIRDQIASWRRRGEKPPDGVWETAPDEQAWRNAARDRARRYTVGTFNRATLDAGYALETEQDTTLFKTWLCVAGDTEVEAVGATHAARRPYEGTMIRLRVADHLGSGGSDDHGVTVTPNHPVLTERGWVAAGEIQEGDHLVRRSLVQDGSGLDPDVQRKPATIAEAFDAAADVRTPERIVRVPVDLDSHRPDGYVDVVPINGVLADRLYPTVQQESDHLVFEQTDVTFPSALPLGALRESAFGDGSTTVGRAHSRDTSRVDRGIFELDAHSTGLAHGADRGVVLAEGLPDGGLRDPEPLAERLGRRTGEVGGDHVVLDRVPRCSASLRDDALRGPRLGCSVLVEEMPSSLTRREQDTGLAEATPDGLRARREVLRDSGGGVASAVAPDQLVDVESDRLIRRPIPAPAVAFDRVVGVESFQFSGHVYDLSVRGGWFFANDYIVHNSTHDERVRNTHWIAHKQSEPMPVPFRVGRGELRFPGDPLGPIEETANCRCSILLHDEEESRAMNLQREAELPNRTDPDGNPLVAADRPQRKRPKPTPERDGQPAEPVGQEPQQPAPGEQPEPQQPEDPNNPNAGPPEGNRTITEEAAQEVQPSADGRWRGLLAPLETRGDYRVIGTPPDGVIRVRDRMWLAYQQSSAPEHNGKVVVGRIDRAWIENGALMGEGVLDLGDPVGQEVHRKLAQGFAGTVSVDLDDAEAEERFYDESGFEVDAPESPLGLMAAGVPAPKRGKPRVPRPEDDDSGESEPVRPSDTDPDRGDGEKGAPDTAPDGDDDPDNEPDEDQPSDDEQGSQPRKLLYVYDWRLGGATLVSDPAFHTANIQLVSPGTTPAQQQAADGQPPPDSDQQDQASSNDTGNEEEKADGDKGVTVTVSSADQHEQYQRDISEPEIKVRHGRTETAAGRSWAEHVAEAARQIGDPPREWFTDPQLDRPTKVTVDDYGRVFGHVACWDTNHISYPGRNVRPPRSATNYAQFHRHPVRCRGGDRVRAGVLVMGTGHADLHMSESSASAHYDHTGYAVADVRAGEDDHGIWIAGALHPEVSALQIQTLDRYSLSGDWRNGELVAALVVNVPGFPIPDDPEALAASGAPIETPRLRVRTGVDGNQFALVASGIVPPDMSATSEPTAGDVTRMGWDVHRAAKRAAVDERLIASAARRVHRNDVSAAFRRVHAPTITAAACRVRRFAEDGGRGYGYDADEMDELDADDHDLIRRITDTNHSLDFNWVDDAGGLPAYIKRISKHLRRKGFKKSHAIATAINAAKKMCRTGDLNFPGSQQVNPGSKAQACAAIARWDAMKASTKAD